MARLRDVPAPPEPPVTSFAYAAALARAASWPARTADGPRPPVLVAEDSGRLVGDGRAVGPAEAVALLDAWLAALADRPGFERFGDWCHHLAAPPEPSPTRPNRRDYQ